MPRPKPLDGLCFLDYYQIIISPLLVVFGAWILLRELFSGRFAAMAWLLGGGFLLFGLYRIKCILDYFLKER